MNDEKNCNICKECDSLRTIPTTIQILTNLNCNLDCSYCYERKNNKVNDLENIKTYLYCKFKVSNNQQVVVELIGGESFLYPELCDNICSYVLELGKKFNRCVIISLCTNGTTLENQKVRDILTKYKNNIYLGVSIDGIEEHHNICRVYKDGKGSYQDAVKWIPWLIETLGQKRIGCKSTFTYETFIKYYSKSMIHTVNLGFTEVAGNIVFEDILPMNYCFAIYGEMVKFIDYIVDNDLEHKIHVFQFGDYDRIRNYEIINNDDIKEAWCGSCNHMMCLGFDGLVYGCNRFCTMNIPGMNIGYLNNDKIEITNQKLIDEVVSYKRDWVGDCNTCVIKSECPTCAAGSYEAEDRDAYIKANRQCGWTHAVSMARSYFKSRLIRKEQNV